MSFVLIIIGIIFISLHHLFHLIGLRLTFRLLLIFRFILGSIVCILTCFCSFITGWFSLGWWSSLHLSIITVPSLTRSSVHFGYHPGPWCQSAYQCWESWWASCNRWMCTLICSFTYLSWILTAVTLVFSMTVIWNGSNYDLDNF